MRATRTSPASSSLAFDNTNGYTYGVALEDTETTTFLGQPRSGTSNCCARPREHCVPGTPTYLYDGQEPGTFERSL